MRHRRRSRLAGYNVYLNDIDDAQLEEAREEIQWSYEKIVENAGVTEAEVALDRITFTTDQEEAVGDAGLVTEAAVEQQSNRISSQT